MDATDSLPAPLEQELARALQIEAALARTAPAAPATGPSSRVRAELVAKSQIDDPRTTAYTALLYAAEYRLVETLAGPEPETEDGRFLLLHWAFRDRKMLPSADYEIGAERTMELVPFETQAALQSLEKSNQSDLFVDALWEIEPENPDPGAVQAAPEQRGLLPAVACGLYALLLGLGLTALAARGRSHPA